MKQVAITVVFLAFALTTKAQDYTKSLSGIEWVKIESKADIVVKTHNSQELLIKNRSSYDEPERAKGLRLLGEGGSDNTEVGFYVIKEGNTLLVKNLRKSDYAEIYLPSSQNVAVTSTWNGDIEISGFTAEIEANAQLNGGIRIKDVAGPVTANVLNGELEVLFTKVNQSSPISLHTTNGVLDVSLPGNTPADLSLGSVNGEIYTNFDLSVPDKNGLRSISSKKVKGAINNGGVSIKLSSTNGNIYLRKQ